MEEPRCEREISCGFCERARRCSEQAQEEHESWVLRKTLAPIRHKIFILSGKGGVGKSTVAVNLAVSLAAQGYRTGLLDIDLNGPNVPKMLGLDGWTLSEDVRSGKIVPFRPFPRLQVASLAGFLPRQDAPVIWRGPLKMLAVRRFLMDMAWGALDFLLVDTPPGTGDEPLSIAQLIPEADGVLLVTTPQEISLLDVRKSARFVEHMNLPVLGILENMNGLQCPHCGDAIPLFRQGGGRRLAEELGVPFLGSLPIAVEVPAHCDQGRPYVLREKTDPWIEALERVRLQVVEAVTSKDAARGGGLHNGSSS